MAGHCVSLMAAVVRAGDPCVPLRVGAAAPVAEDHVLAAAKTNSGVTHTLAHLE